MASEQCIRAHRVRLQQVPPVIAAEYLMVLDEVASVRV